MKILRLLPFLLILLLSCDTTDESNVNEDVTSNDDMSNNDVGNTPEISLQNAFPQLVFDQPLDLQAPDDGTNRIFVVEKKGKIRVFENQEDITQTVTFLDLGNNLSTASEQGVLGMAFHPDFRTNGFFYVSYTPSENESVISRFSVASSDTNLADATSEMVLLRISQPFTNHNGGQIAFGPDGYLYIAMGDGGSAGDPFDHGQTTSSLLGNILRIDVNSAGIDSNYTIPADNPFVNDSDFRSEIYAYGFRNPWRMSFDTQTGKLWTGDVGQGKIEEIDVVESGGNYGWKLFEGTDCFSGDCNPDGLEMPVFEYNHDNGDRSITGGYVYRGQNISSFQGLYIYGDFVSGRIWGLSTNLEGNLSNQLLMESNLPISSFGTDANNELYVCAFNGAIYKFVQN